MTYRKMLELLQNLDPTKLDQEMVSCDGNDGIFIPTELQFWDGDEDMDIADGDPYFALV